MSPTKYDSTGRRRSTVRQDAHGSVILSDGYEDVIQLDALGDAGELYCCDRNVTVYKISHFHDCVFPILLSFYAQFMLHYIYIIGIFKG